MLSGPKSRGKNSGQLCQTAIWASVSADSKRRTLSLTFLALIANVHQGLSAESSWNPLVSGPKANAVEATLLHYGSTVTDWETFSPQLTSGASCSSPGSGSAAGGAAPPAPPRVGYFTRHTGTLWDWMAVAASLELNWERRNPRRYGKYGMSGPAAAELWRRNGSELCAPSYDIVVYCDTVVDARAALQGGCSAPVLLQVTNRFDWKVKDLPAYVGLISRTAASNERVWWVTNSPFEALYMSWQGLVLPPERHLLLRPLGATVLPAAPLPPDRAARFALVLKGNRRKHPDRDVLLPRLRALGVEHLVQVYDRQYGGPAALSQHRGVIHLPYQVSIMSLYETLAMGGVFLVPAPAFFRVLRQKHRFAYQFVPLLERARREGFNWTDYVEFYHPDFREAVVAFSSWEHLLELMRLPAEDAMWVGKRAAARAAMARVRQHSLEGWRRVMGELTRLAC